jgi:Ca-activated chloride channel family protein
MKDFRFPFATVLDFSPLVDFWRGQAADPESVWSALATEVLAQVEGVPELTGPVEDAEEQFSVSLHSVILEKGPPWKIRLQPGERLNRDFILRFPVAAETVQTSLIASADEGKSQTFALTLVPPAVQPGAHTPRDVVVVLDRSGSMNGWKMVAARRAVGRIVDSLLDNDRFSVLAFDYEIEQPPQTSGRLCQATDRVRWRTIEWLGKIEARGGTEMAGAMAEAVRLLDSADSERQPILILVTDGQVAGEDAILRTVTRQSPSGRIPRIHTIGIDRAVNAGFLRRLADTGSGTCDLVESEDRLDAAMDHIHRGIATAALADLKLEAVTGLLVKDSLAPARLPDLFADRPITLLGQSKESSLSLRISGTDASGNTWQSEVTAVEGPSDTIRSLWGRARVRDLEDRYTTGDTRNPKTLAKEIVKVSLDTNVLSRFTAYVAVDRSEVVNKGGKQRQVVQPVELPDGWDASDDALMLGSFLGGAVPAQSLSAGPPPELSRAIQSEKRCRKSRFRTPDTESLSVEEVLGEIQGLTAPVQDIWVSRTRKRRPQLERLLKLLRELAAKLRPTSRQTQRIVEELAEEIEKLLEDYKQGNKQVLHADTLNKLFAQIHDALENIPDSPQEERREFWT